MLNSTDRINKVQATNLLFKSLQVGFMNFVQKTPPYQLIAGGVEKSAESFIGENDCVIRSKPADEFRLVIYNSSIPSFAGTKVLFDLLPLPHHIVR